MTFPRGADERTGANDSPLAVYLLVPHSKIRGPKAVKYIWSERVPVGTQAVVERRPHAGHGVAQRPARQAGSNGSTSVSTHWPTSSGCSGRATTPKPAGIAVLTDGDDTNSRSEGEYADFRACKR